MPASTLDSVAPVTPSTIVYTATDGHLRCKTCYQAHPPNPNNVTGITCPTCGYKEG